MLALLPFETLLFFISWLTDSKWSKLYNKPSGRKENWKLLPILKYRVYKRVVESFCRVEYFLSQTYFFVSRIYTRLINSVVIVILFVCLLLVRIITSQLKSKHHIQHSISNRNFCFFSCIIAMVHQI